MKEIDYYINDIDLVNILLNCESFSKIELSQIFALNDKNEINILIDLFIKYNCFEEENGNYIKTKKFIRYLLNKKKNGFKRLHINSKRRNKKGMCW